MPLYESHLETPIWKLGLFSSDQGVAAIALGTRAVPRIRKWLKSHFEEARFEKSPERNARLARQLTEYFDGKRRAFNLPLDLRGTEFQIDVWNAVGAIPYGTTATYQEIAHLVGRPDAVRAVGAANGANPVSLIIPCHRVLGTDGSLTGYGGGIANKRKLLVLEGAMSDPADQMPLF